MSYTTSHNEKNDRRKSAIITLLISLLVLLALYFYKFSRSIPREEPITTMLINFGDNKNGDGLEEPANQEGSQASSAEVTVEEPKPQPQPEPKPVAQEKIITGTNKVATAPKVEKVEKKNTPTAKPTTPKTTTTKAATNSKNAVAPAKTQGDSKGTAAVGNLIRGRGTATGSQGTNGTTGNAGDPLGGDGNGDSKIGVDRKLISYIPGTMGRGGSQPAHNCSASGTITISYMVDKAGNVTSARRSGGISDACVSSTSVSWVKQYVKAERANTSSTGTYRITF